MTQKVYFHAPKCTFNPDPFWDQKWNYLDPCGPRVYQKLLIWSDSWRRFLVIDAKNSISMKSFFQPGTWLDFSGIKGFP